MVFQTSIQQKVSIYYYQYTAFQYSFTFPFLACLITSNRMSLLLMPDPMLALLQEVSQVLVLIHICLQWGLQQVFSVSAEPKTGIEVPFHRYNLYVIVCLGSSFHRELSIWTKFPPMLFSCLLLLTQETHGVHRFTFKAWVALLDFLTQDSSFFST